MIKEMGAGMIKITDEVRPECWFAPAELEALREDAKEWAKWDDSEKLLEEERKEEEDMFEASLVAEYGKVAAPGDGKPERIKEIFAADGIETPYEMSRKTGTGELSYGNEKRQWYKDGKLHGDDGPAVELSNGTELWYQEGKIHREDGPAIVWADGTKEWWLHDKQVSEEEGRAAHPANRLQRAVGTPKKLRF